MIHPMSLRVISWKFLLETFDWQLLTVDCREDQVAPPCFPRKPRYELLLRSSFLSVSLHVSPPCHEYANVSQGHPDQQPHAGLFVPAQEQRVEDEGHHSRYVRRSATPHSPPHYKLNPRSYILISAGVLGFLQEVLARHLAGVPTRKVHSSAGPLEHLFAATKVNAKAFKMGLFGFLISAPLGHVLVKTMHRMFAGRSGPGAKLGMLATSLLVIAPIQIAVFLTNSAVVEGARTGDAIMRVLKRGFAPVLGVTWITSPTAIIFAQTFLPPEFEIPFFNLVQFCTGVRLLSTPITVPSH